MRAVLCAAAVAAGLAMPATAATPRNPCTLSWGDVAGDTGLSLAGTGPAAPDDDLDIRQASVTATATDVVVVARVTKLSSSGPLYGTGHGLALSVVKYGTKATFAARRDAVFGDTTYATNAGGTSTRPDVRLALDPAANTFTLTVHRADIATATRTPSAGGSFTYVAVNTIRSDARSAQEATGATVSPGSVADESGPADGVGLSLDACDAALRETSLRLAVTAGSVVATLRDGTGAALAHAPVRLYAGRYAATARTDGTGRATFAVPRGRTVTVVYDGVAGRHNGARGTART